MRLRRQVLVEPEIAIDEITDGAEPPEPILVDGDEYGPEFATDDEMHQFVAWHESGDQRTLEQTDTDDDLAAQVEWWRNGGHLLIEPE